MGHLGLIPLLFLFGVTSELFCLNYIDLTLLQWCTGSAVIGQEVIVKCWKV